MEDTNDDAVDEDLPFLQTSLYTIAQSCKQYDIDAAKDMLEQLNQRQHSTKHKKLLKDIATHLLYGDFDEASALAFQFAQRTTINETS